MSAVKHRDIENMLKEFINEERPRQEFVSHLKVSLLKETKHRNYKRFFLAIAGPLVPLALSVLLLVTINSEKVLDTEPARGNGEIIGNQYPNKLLEENQQASINDVIRRLQDNKQVEEFMMKENMLLISQTEEILSKLVILSNDFSSVNLDFMSVDRQSNLILKFKGKESPFGNQSVELMIDAKLGRMVSFEVRDTPYPPYEKVKVTEEIALSKSKEALHYFFSQGSYKVQEVQMLNDKEALVTFEGLSGIINIGVNGNGDIILLTKAK